jgi:uncharacterized protein with beta-barrel porin domain
LILRTCIVARAAGVAVLLALPFLFSQPVSAQLPPAGAWNLYDGYSDTVRLQFNDPIPNPVATGTTPTLNVSLGGSQALPFTVDTGSTGMVVSQEYFKLDPTKLKMINPNGSIIYTSSGKNPTGPIYEVPIEITGKDGQNRVRAVVQVLVAQESGYLMMGVGFDRGGNTGKDGTSANNPLYPTPAMNAFLSITDINGKPVSDASLRKGYIVGQDGVRLGLTSPYTSDFSMVKLSTNTIAPQNKWNRAPMSFSVDSVQAGSGAFLPDTGIAYVLIATPDGTLPSNTVKCADANVGGRCAAPNTMIGVNLTPGLPADVRTTLALTATNDRVSGQPNMPPFVHVEERTPLDEQTLSTPFAFNSGQFFYQYFDYLFDYEGGYVGYRPIAGQSFVVVMSLQDKVPLPAGFISSFTSYLAADTTLVPAGQSTFNAPLHGLGNRLTVDGPGAVAFNGAVALGSARLDVLQGTAAINAGLTAGSVTIAAPGTLTNAVGSTITANVTNSGTLNNGGVVSGNVSNSGVLSGSGTISGNLVHSGTIAPGNSIGTVTVGGSYAHQAGSLYQVEVTGAANGGGQSDRIAVAGNAALAGGQVTVSALPGAPFGYRTTYTILSAAGGVSGAFASLSDPYPFLQSSLSYDPNNVYLTLQVGGFAAQAATPNQYAVGQALDAGAPTASGDFGGVLGSLATASSNQGQAFMTAVSGTNYAGFSTSMVLGAQLFMNNFADQTRGGGGVFSNRVALAEACDVACDPTAPPLWGAWGGGLGGLGTIGANQPIGAVTYNVGGFAAGLDRMITPTTRLGVTAGYTAGSQWVGGYDGTGRTDTFQAGLYGGFAQDKVYADAIIGYAYSYNQMWRNITIPGLQQRTAQGRTGANQFFGQLETGYRVDVGGAAEAFVTPFVRLQAYTGTQNAFTETGAQSLNLSVVQQTTNSLRTVIGAQLGGAMNLGWRDKLAMQFRLGWSHEYADTGRPVTATLAGVPAMAFTTYGVTALRDSVLLGLSANTTIAEATAVYLRYEGNVSGQDSTHALTAGLRMTW